MIDLKTVWLLIKNLPLEEKVFKAAEGVYNTKEWATFEDAAEEAYAVFGGTVTRDPVTNHIVTLNPLPQHIGGHPSGTDPGRI